MNKELFYIIVDVLKDAGYETRLYHDMENSFHILTNDFIGPDKEALRPYVDVERFEIFKESPFAYRGLSIDLAIIKVRNTLIDKLRFYIPSKELALSGPEKTFSIEIHGLI